MRQLLMGNEAIARGAVEAGLDVAAAYPGTPSSEIVGTLAGMAKEFGFHAEWSVNEKVALEVAAGAAYAGASSLVAMKQVGLNVAADPLMSLAYIGVRGALVIVVADDPGPHSSQTEQDTRRYGPLAKLPILDPCSPAEAKAMTLEAFALSRRTGLPVILRPTTRVCHACGPVEMGPVPARAKPPGFERDGQRVILPRFAATRHVWLEERMDAVRAEFAASPLNHVTGQGRLGIVAGGVSYLYAVEALRSLGLEAAVWKVGTPHPFPYAPARDFLSRTERVLVVEEEDPVLEEGMLLAAAGLTGAPAADGTAPPPRTPPIFGKYTGHLPRTGEYGPDLVRAAIALFAGVEAPPAAAAASLAPVPELPQRPPSLCAGCPHRSVFYAVKSALKGKDPVYGGDIGCYTLGAAAPLNTIDTCLCMGAAVTIADGLSLAEPARPHVTFIGDSTFLHMGITGLVNAAYNGARLTLVILDNATTAMTGHQPHPGMGVSATGERAPAVDLAALARACGAGFVETVDAYDRAAVKRAVLQALEAEGPSVVIARRACAVIARPARSYHVSETCTNCRRCLRELGCPALAAREKPFITAACHGCGLCAEVCPGGSIVEA
ncbi:MAG: indolepyruvate ferredoxin oxidoreductase subunit alpha [Patescibacteria group bacterium]